MTFRDGLGDRILIDEANGAAAEILSLRRELSTVPSFEFALRERAGRLASFRHPSYAHVRSVDRSTEFSQALTVVSDFTPGVRLSELLATSAARNIPLSLDVAVCLIRQLVPAVALLHETARDVAHGAIAPERLIVTSQGRLIIGEYVLGSALEQLLFSRERYWTELRVALPRVAGLPRFDHLGDVTQIGVVALSLIVGRTLTNDEYPAHVGDVVASATAVSSQGTREPIPARLREWLNRVLQLDPRHSFPSAVEARVEFEKLVEEIGYAAPESLDKFLKRYHTVDQTVTPAPVSATAERAVTLPADLKLPARFTESSTKDTAAPALAVSAAPSAILPVRTTPDPEPIADPEPEFAAVMDEESKVEAPRSRGRLVTLVAATSMALAILAVVALVGARRMVAEKPAPALPPAASSLVLTMTGGNAEAVIDGARRGSTPLTLTLSPGPHKIELHAVVMPPIEAPPVASPTVAAAAPPVAAPASEESPAPGWITATGKLDLQIFEGGRLLGTSQVDRIMMSAGRHELELVNEQVGYRNIRTLQVAAGRVTTINVDPPKGSIALNASPWAEVWMDGVKVGETPIGNLAVSVGPHEVVFKNPDLGEKRETVLVTLKAPARVSVDLRAR